MDKTRWNETSNRHPAGAPSGCDLSVVIPVYRSEATLELLLQRLLSALRDLGRTFEIVLVDDGSPDGSWSQIELLQSRYREEVVAIQLMRNFGQHNALMCGLRRARGRFVLTMDDDLQNPPEEIGKLLLALEQGDCDLVYGNYGEKKHSSFRNLGSLVVNEFYRRVFRTRVTVTSFRLIRRPLVEAILNTRHPAIFLDGLLAWNTQRISSVPVAHHPRQEGRSTYSLGRLVGLAMNLFTCFSLIPLRFVSAIGAMVFATGIVLGLVAGGLWLFGGGSVGSIPVIAVCSVLAGLQLFAVGLLGEYVGRMQLTMSGKPQYRERQVLDRQTPANGDESISHLGELSVGSRHDERLVS